ncbi:glycosyl transferase family 2 [Haloarculaceae archaeon H-GB2-1]|nr:glycosyl transferase family 2 [Haloarculaceae archaeon H-GB1-1]MEA5387702.1 glycosyl transferase family 2 [Haloarculaceae archaeon H-GB11]MEA5409192.1 glycosyl transferase family 2 [Haloarculaceae archaeon H-GB2-1]
MEYVQELVTTLHDFGGASPDAPLAETTVVVPLTERDHGSPAAERVFRILSSLDLDSVLVALHADRTAVTEVTEWLGGFDPTPEVLWCTAPPVEQLLAQHGLGGGAGKGRDVWLALGIAAARSSYVVVHDADATSYGPSHVPKLCAPLANGHDFVKGYYARVEDGRLYGRLFRLFFTPLVRELAQSHDAPILRYLSAFRYALAGEFAATASLARQLRVQRDWGLEVGTLGDAFAGAGFERSAQVDLGVHEHDHRAVSGEQGLGSMADQVGRALFRVVEDAGVDPDYGSLPARYRAAARRLVEQYAADAAFNGLDYDAAGEREQVRTYADAVRPPEADTRLPAWSETDLDPVAVGDAARDALGTCPER